MSEKFDNTHQSVNMSLLYVHMYVGLIVNVDGHSIQPVLEK